MLKSNSQIKSVATDLGDFFNAKVPATSCISAVTGNYFEKITLPAQGKKPENCKGIYPKYFCPNCGKPHFSKGNCERSTCPDCETSWRFNRCQSILERIISAKLFKNLRVRHFVVSKRPEEFEDIEDMDSLNKYFREVYEFAQEKNVDGGVCLFHPYRILPSEKKKLLNEVGEDNEFKAWRKLLKLDNWKSKVYFAPHFHILGVKKQDWNNPEDSGFEEGKDSDKFLWKGIGELSDVSDIGQCSMYLLSHLGVMEGKHYNSIRWFGSLSPSCWSLKRAKNLNLRDGSNVKEKTLEKVSEFMEVDHEEEEGNMDCSNCGHSLLHIKSAEEYLDVQNYSKETEVILEIAYQWWRGSIPPPENFEKMTEEEAYIWLERKAVKHLTNRTSISSEVGRVENLNENQTEFEEISRLNNLNF